MKEVGYTLDDYNPEDKMVYECEKCGMRSTMKDHMEIHEVRCKIG